MQLSFGCLTYRSQYILAIVINILPLPAAQLTRNLNAKPVTFLGNMAQPTIAHRTLGQIGNFQHFSLHLKTRSAARYLPRRDRCWPSLWLMSFHGLGMRSTHF